MLSYGFKNLILCDKCGIICSKSEGATDAQRAMLKVTNLADEEGTLSGAMRGADIFVGVSAPNIVSEEMVSSMNDDAILFAMVNPVPEICPDVARRAGARVVGTGSFGLPRQIDNVVAFPGIFKGAPRGARDAHHQRYEARRRLRARRSRVRRGALRGLHHARTLRPARRRGSCRRRAQLRGGLGAHAVDARRHTAEPAQPVESAQAPAGGACRWPARGNSPRCFVTFEGGDGVGKSTHIRYVANELRLAGREVVCLREPGGTGIGESLRAMVLDPDNGEISSEAELLMYEAARASWFAK